MKSTWQRRSEQMAAARMFGIIYWIIGIAAVLGMGMQAIA